MATALPRTVRLRPTALLCCLLTLLAAFDSLPSLQVVLGSQATTQRFPPAPDDDDEMLDLGCEATAARSSRSEPRISVSAPPLTESRRIPSPFSRHTLAVPPVSEHAYRNGLGAPLLC
jgi:hypothetical protein